MKKENPALDKSYSFALKVVKLCLKIQGAKQECVLSKQLLRSATSIGSNTEEAMGAQSDKDFLHKISIACKEARESHYWNRLMVDSELIIRDEAENLLLDVEELLRILESIQKALK